MLCAIYEVAEKTVVLEDFRIVTLESQCPVYHHVQSRQSMKSNSTLFAVLLSPEIGLHRNLLSESIIPIFSLRILSNETQFTECSLEKSPVLFVASDFGSECDIKRNRWPCSELP